MSPLKSVKLAHDLLERGKKMLGESNAPPPLEYVLAQLWDIDNDPATRLRCAEIALPYCSPRLSAVTVNNPDENRLVVEFVDFRRQQAISDGGQTGHVLVSRPNPAVEVMADLIDDDDGK